MKGFLKDLKQAACEGFAAGRETAHKKGEAKRAAREARYRQEKSARKSARGK